MSKVGNKNNLETNKQNNNKARIEPQTASNTESKFYEIANHNEIHLLKFTCLHTKNLFDVIIENPAITSMIFSNIEMKPKEIQCIAQQIGSLNANHNVIKKLYFNGCKISNDGADELSNLLSNNKTLTKLSVADNNIGMNGLKSIAAAIKTNSSPEYLNLNSNKIRSAAITPLADALKVNKTLICLHLSFNNLGDRGTQLLAKALEKNNTLLELHLSSVNMGPNGINSLANALKLNQNLSVLNLSCNSLGNDGAKKVAKLIRKSCSLKELNLHKTDLEDAGIESLKTSLQLNGHLKKLNISSNGLSAKAVDSLVEVVKFSTSISYINLENNDITVEECIKLSIGALDAQRFRGEFLIEINMNCNINNEEAKLLNIMQSFINFTTSKKNDIDSAPNKHEVNIQIDNQPDIKVVDQEAVTASNDNTSSQEIINLSQELSDSIIVGSYPAPTDGNITFASGDLAPY